MAPTKSQTFITAATLLILAGSILGSVSAAPLFEDQQLFGRGALLSKVSNQLSNRVSNRVSNRIAKETVGAVRGHHTGRDTTHKDPVQQGAGVAIISRVAKRVGKEIVGTMVQNKAEDMNKRVVQHVKNSGPTSSTQAHQDVHIPNLRDAAAWHSAIHVPGPSSKTLKDAATMVTPPYDPWLVKAATNMHSRAHTQHPGHKRDLAELVRRWHGSRHFGYAALPPVQEHDLKGVEELLSARSHLFDSFEELD